MKTSVIGSGADFDLWIRACAPASMSDGSIVLQCNITCPQCGHSAAETITCNDFIACGGENGAKEAGKMRAEGKGYRVKDGAVLHFLFNT